MGISRVKMAVRRFHLKRQARGGKVGWRKTTPADDATILACFKKVRQPVGSLVEARWVSIFGLGSLVSDLWFGIFETSKVVLIAVGVFFPIYLSLSDALRNVDRKLVEVGQSFRFQHHELILRILLPATLPTYLVSLRTGLGLGWMFVVAAEFMGAEYGLGYLLIDGQQTGRPAVILGAIVIFALLGKLTDWPVALLARCWLSWQDGFQTGENHA